MGWGKGGKATVFRERITRKCGTGSPEHGMLVFFCTLSLFSPMSRILRFSLLSLLLLPAFVRAEFFGGVSPDMQGHDLRLSLGGILWMDGSVNETFRAFYKASGQDSKQSLAESYDLDDFGVKTPFRTLGFHYERQWPYGALRWNTTYLSFSANSTAKRDYYLGLSDHIRYNGHKYDHLKIPRGRKFSVDFTGVMTDLTYGFTPVTFLYDDIYAKFTPSLDIGLVLIGGWYDIDAGHSTGTAVYQNPPVDFVVGGSSSSFIGAGAPMIGLSGDFRVELEGDRLWVNRLGFGYFSYDGSSSFLTSKGHRSKELDISVLSISGETSIRFPLQNGNAISLGLKMQILTADGDIKSKEKDTEAIIAARERFNKSFDFKMISALFFVGYSF